MYLTMFPRVKQSADSTSSRYRLLYSMDLCFSKIIRYLSVVSVLCSALPLNVLACEVAYLFI